MKKLLILIIWFPVTILTLLSSIFFFSYRHNIHAQEKIKQGLEKITRTKDTYKMYTSVPKVLGMSSTKVKKADAVPESIRQYLSEYNSPMLGTTNKLVSSAREHSVDPFLMVAIAQCESNLGKKMPPSCYNPFGWGIHSEGTLCFDSWEEGYQTVAQGLKENYGDLMHNPEKMMERYTPPSLKKGGPWAKCITQFMKELE